MSNKFLVGGQLAAHVLFETEHTSPLFAASLAVRRIGAVTGAINLELTVSKTLDGTSYWNRKEGSGPRVMAADTLEDDEVRDAAGQKPGSNHTYYNSLPYWE